MHVSMMLRRGLFIKIRLTSFIRSSPPIGAIYINRLQSLLQLIASRHQQQHLLMLMWCITRHRLLR